MFDRNSSAHRLLAAGTCGSTNFLPRVHSVASYEEALRDVGCEQTIRVDDLRSLQTKAALFDELRQAGIVI